MKHEKNTVFCRTHGKYGEWRTKVQIINDAINLLEGYKGGIKIDTQARRDRIDVAIQDAWELCKIEIDVEKTIKRKTK